MNRNVLPVPADTLRPSYTFLPDGSVHFGLECQDARWLDVAGTFSDWAPVAMQPRPGSKWEALVPTPGRGAHFYKYVIEGRWIADPTHPMGAADGFGGFNSAFVDSLGEPLPAGALRAVSLNLHTYQEPDPLHKLEQVAYGAVALGANVLLLQEVGEHIYEPHKRPNAGEVIRTALERWSGREWHHQWRESHVGFGMYREGLSILADVPLQDVAEYRLSGGRYARNALAATVRLDKTYVRLCTTHLSWPSAGGDAEAAALLKALEAAASPRLAGTLIAGDLNAEPNDEAVRILLGAGYRDAAADAGDNGLTVLMQRWQGASIVPDPCGELFARVDYQFWKGKGKARACRRVFNRNGVGNIYLPRVSDHVGLAGVYDVGAS
jgi:endonuclease/exonuclease/phosphatase family metal-dependent hydrolase